MRRAPVLAAAAAMALVGLCASVQAATATLWPAQGWAPSVSTDGQIVCGTTGNPSMSPVLWTASGGFTTIPLLAGASNGQAKDMSADGSKIVGQAYVSSGNGGFVWSQATGTVALTLPGTGHSSSADSISSDGSVIFGTGMPQGSSTQQFVRWNGGTATVLGTVTGVSATQAYSCNADGSEMVGIGFTGADSTAVRWTAPDGVVNLGTLPGTAGSMAWSTSPDGSVAYGSSYDAGKQNGYDRKAWRWTQAGGMVEVVGMSHVLSASSGGTRLVGATSYNATAGRIDAAVWDSGTITNVNDFMAANGLSFGNGWYAQVVADMSADGTVLVGQASNGSQFAGFVITGFTAVPEPTAMGLLAFASCGLLTRKRQKRA